MTRLHGRSDCPKLILLDNRLKGDNVNRQLPYSGELTAEPIRRFIREQGLPFAASATVKDEL